MDIDTIRWLTFYFPHDIVKIVDKFIKPKLKFIEFYNVKTEDFKVVGIDGEPDVFCFTMNILYLDKIFTETLICFNDGINDNNKINLNVTTMNGSLSWGIKYDKKERIFSHPMVYLNNIKLTNEEHLNVCEEFDKLSYFLKTNIKSKIKNDD